MNKFSVIEITNKYNKTYTNEFKREAIKLALKFPNISGATTSLGISEATLHTI